MKSAIWNQRFDVRRSKFGVGYLLQAILIVACCASCFASDTSPDTIAKYLAGLAVPAATADSIAPPVSSTAPTTATPPPSKIENPKSKIERPRPGSLIPNRNAAPPSVLPTPSSSQPLNPSTSQLPPVTVSGDPWLVHSSELDHAWNHATDKQLAAIANWAPNNLGPAYEFTGTMFYMFSGPDFLYAHAFFPNARTYILVGNEPVGPIPDINRISPNELPVALANIRKSLESVLNWSFFITKEMKVDLTQPQLSGTLPLLYVFLARANCAIDSVTLVTIDSAGNLIEGESKKEEHAQLGTARVDGGAARVAGASAGSASDQGKSETPGVRITFRNHSTSQQLNPSTQIVYYFCTDLSDDGIKSTPGLMKFCENQSQGRGVSLLKAASYLMHEPGFSRVREFLLGHSDTIVQDDSGIPFRFFVENGNGWNLQLSGPYAGPIDIFKQYYQPDLANAFATRPGSPLPFGFGYQWGPTKSNLMVAVHR